jgi:hypothetical protein
MSTDDQRPPAPTGGEQSRSSLAPGFVDRVGREVIENKLLAALSDDGVVAILASERDLSVMIAALEYAMLGNREQTRKARELAADMRKLKRAAFPPNP